MEKGCKALLLTAPRVDWTYAEYLAIQQLADEYGVDYLDFNLDDVWDAAGVDVQTDFYNATHINAYGAVKISQYLADYWRSTIRYRTAGPTKLWPLPIMRDYERFRTEMEERRAELFPEEP